MNQSVGVICACLPTLRPVFTKFFPKSGLESRNATVTKTQHSLRAHERNNFARLREESKGITVTTEMELESGISDGKGKLTEEEVRNDMWRYKG